MTFVFVWLTSLSMIISRSIHIAANGNISLSYLNLDISVKLVVPLNILREYFDALSLLWWFPLKFSFLLMWEYGISSALTTATGWKVLCAGSCSVHTCPPHPRHEAPTCTEMEPIHFYSWALLTAGSRVHWHLILIRWQSQEVKHQELITPHTPSQNQAPRAWGGTWAPLSKTLQEETSRTQECGPSQCDPNPSAYLWWLLLQASEDNLAGLLFSLKIQ